MQPMREALAALAWLPHASIVPTVNGISPLPGDAHTALCSVEFSRDPTSPSPEGNLIDNPGKTTYILKVFFFFLQEVFPHSLPTSNII